MNKPLRILHLEDEPDFSALVTAIIEREGLDAEVNLVTDLTGFQAALEEGNFDVIIADYMLPSCSGIQALGLAREKYPRIPFLLLSGAIGEHAAIEILRSGATDYVLKNRLDRLVPALRRAVEEAKERTQRIEAQSAARQSEAQYQLIFDGSPVPVWVSDLDTRAFLEVNEAAIQQYGYSREEFTNLTTKAVCSPEEISHLAEHLSASSGAQPEARIGHAGVWPHRNKNGTTMDVDVTWSIIKFQDRDAVLTIAHNVTELRQAAEALKKSEASLAAAQRIARLGSWELDLAKGEALETAPLHWSDETWRIFGMKPRPEPVTAEMFFKAAHVDDRKRVKSAMEEALRKKEPFELEHRILLSDGEVRIVRERAELTLDDAGEPLQLRGIVMDITAQKRLEERSNQSQKMDAIGALAGELAHDFNNVLTVTHGHALLLLGEKKLSKSGKESAQQIARTAESAAGLTQSLLTFSRRQDMQLRRIDLNQMLNSMTAMLERILGEGVTLQLKCYPQPAIVQADSGMFEQVLLDLAMNARDTMPKGGQLAIDVFPISLGADNLTSHPEGRPGKFICLSVADNGSGIEPDQLTRIFEPFASTKEAGKHAGLGLATVYGIVKQHEGWIEVESEPGNGATFRVYLPASRDKDDDAGKKTAPQKVKGGTETILVVEDEEPVRELVCKVLTAYGYNVLEAISGTKAIELWKKSKEQVDLLLTDVVLPDELNGRELAERLRKSRPQLKVIFSSGYSQDIMGKDFTPQKGQVFLQKPYVLQKLAQTVRTCLDRGR
jgi:PAS domain S-box-containing protein